MENLSLGDWRSLRKGGRYAAPGDFSKINIKQGDLGGWQGYLELLMKKEDKSRWEWFLSAKDGVVNYTKRITASGINYIILEITLKDRLPITLFLYSTPDNHLNLYWPGRGNTSVEACPMYEIYDIDLTDQTNVEILKFGSATILERFSEESHIKTHIYCEYVKKLVGDEFKDKEFQDLYKLHPYFAYLTGTIVFGPGKIRIKEETFGYDFEVVADIKMMIEDFENRVVLKTAGTTRKPKKAPVIGGKDKQLLFVHPDAANWLSRLFGWKTKGIDTKLGDSDMPIIQFDKGVLYKKIITGSTDYAVWPCSSWDETPFDEDLGEVTQLKQLYPGIDCTDIFMSDSD